MTNQQELEQLVQRMYRETMERLEDPCWSKVAQKVTLLYGPPMVLPDVFLVSFQGGGGDPSPSLRTWPDKLLYLDDHYPDGTPRTRDDRFGKTLRQNFCDAGLWETLTKRTVAMAACFPESAEPERWTDKQGPRAEWRKFSSAWVKCLIAAMRPRVVLVIGEKASKALEVHDEWHDVERRESDRHMVYARMKIEGCPAVYCHHLSQGSAKVEVQKYLRELKRIASAGG